MATTRGGKLIPIEQQAIDRVSGKQDQPAQDFFGAGQPIQPAAQEQAKGRTFDYPTAYNTTITPRADSSNTGYIGFDALRRVADPAQGGLDIVALVIESIKDQICGQTWNIVGRDGTDGGEKAKLIIKQLSRPDGINSFRTWLRPIIHDHLTIDQPAIYIRPTGNKTPILDVMDGATIKLLIDPYGRTPQPPYAAYQQNIKGIPAVDYTTDELVIPIYNKRSNKVYGYSRVEQCINIIGLGLRRQLSQIEYYTAGSVPDLLIGVPATWNVDQLSQFQEWFDSILAGNSADRRKARFIPGDTKPYPIKEPVLKDQLDEWVARVVSYCFSVAPDWAVAQVNKATAEVQKQTAMEQGVQPIKEWLRDVMHIILEKAYDAPELDFQWVAEQSVDPKIQSEILNGYVLNGILEINEAREQLGLDPIEQEAQIVATPLAFEPPLIGKKKRAWDYHL